MIGNVWEWVADPWSDNLDGYPTDGSPRRGDGLSRGLRGGSWDDVSRGARAGVRNGVVARNRDSNVGFRAARTL